MYTNNNISPERRKKINKFGKNLLIFHAVFAMLFFITFKLPIIPNEWMVDNIGKITFTILSSLLFYYLFFCKGTSGKSILLEGLKYRCHSLTQRVVACCGIIGFCGIFYLIGKLSVPILAAPTILISGEYKTNQTILEHSTRGQRWYKGYTKLVFKLTHENRKIAFYWPTNQAQHLTQGSIINITSNQTWFGSQIIEIKKAD